MSSRPPRLPPLNALRVFRAVLRRGSFRAAGQELLVSPQAVSQQIKSLEDAVGVTLFSRKGRLVEPTEQAMVLSHFVEAGFAEFEEGIRRITTSGLDQRININVSPYFATRYLMARLERFRSQRPGTDLRLTTMVDTPDFARDDVDVSIQWGFGEWMGHDVTLLIRDPKILCCTAELAARIGTPHSLLSETLLHTVMAKTFWSDVLNHLGVSEPPQGKALEFGDADTMRRATLSGLGVGLLSEVDARADIRSGQLVAPFGISALANMPEIQVPGFYLIVPKAHKRVTLIAAFCDWITAEDWTEEPGFPRS